MSKDLGTIFYRMSAAGNTFVLADNRDNTHASLKDSRKEFVKKVCGSFVGFQTDGFIFLDSSSEYDFQWDFYNSDGSPAEMCGNAARAVAFYCWHCKDKKEKISFLTKAGPVEVVTISDDIFEVKMPKVQGEPVLQKLNNGVEGFFVNTGVPHFVVDQGLTRDKAAEIRFAKDFGLSGTNVTSITHLKKETQSYSVKAVTFERGVDNFTLSCGTGAVAAALVTGLKICDTRKVSVEMPGGILEVRFETIANDQREIQAYLKGPAKVDFIFFLPETEK